MTGQVMDKWVSEGEGIHTLGSCPQLTEYVWQEGVCYS